ncbi:MAG: RNA polymerase sigma factor [Acidiferrobacterales bacterium]|nr:RNA polymerase sigma factor [Acidiferrobacterales bacterium]
MNHLFNKAIEIELPSLWRFALRLSKSESIAEELVQRTCLRAIERKHQLKNSAKIRSWLFSILHSIWKNELRSSALRAEASLSLQSTLPMVNADNSEQSHDLKQVLHAVYSLPEAQREVMLLICAEGYSYKEAAEILEIPTGTVMSRLARARENIGETFSARNQTKAKSNTANPSRGAS